MKKQYSSFTTFSDVLKAIYALRTKVGTFQERLDTTESQLDVKLSVSIIETTVYHIKLSLRIKRIKINFCIKTY